LELEADQTLNQRTGLGAEGAIFASLKKLQDENEVLLASSILATNIILYLMYILCTSRQYIVTFFKTGQIFLEGLRQSFGSGSYPIFRHRYCSDYSYLPFKLFYVQRKSRRRCCH
jgi:hypothetical protein